jgi:hypothetical protein
MWGSKSRARAAASPVQSQAPRADASGGMKGRLKLGQLLVAQGLIQPEDLAAALSAQQECGGGRLGAALIASGAIGEEQLIQVLAEQLGVQVARVGERTVSAEIIDLLPGEVAEKHRCLPLFLRDGKGGEVLVLGMEDPSDADALGEVQKHVRCGLMPVLIAPSELEAALLRYYEAADPLRANDPMQLGKDLPQSPASLPAALDVVEPLPLPPMKLSAAPADASWSEPADDLGVEEDPFGGEDPFAEFEKEPFAGDVDPLLREELTNPVMGPTAPGPPRASMRQDAVLQALAQLLVEKGVITRDEFAARLRKLTLASD